jgi:UDPglucose 6-dehydrogenase
MDQTTIGFIGLGKLGLECAEIFAGRYRTLGYDVSPRKSDLVEIKASIHEVLVESQWIFIAVPTPHADGYDGSVPSSELPPTDFGYDDVMTVLESIKQHCDHEKNIVLISTVLPGTVRKRFANEIDPQHNFFYNPYLIAMGSVKWDMVNPEMVMIGTDRDDKALAQTLIDLYQPIMQNDPRYVTGTWEECEAIKIFYNTFISAKIALVNMIQDFATRIGNINVDVVTDALAGSTMRIMGAKYMTAGMGDAGACHPRDNIALRWLAQEYDLGYDLFATIVLARERQARNLAWYLIDVAERYDLTGSIVIHGKAYKPDVPYCIGSYSTLIGHYIQENGIQVKYLDPLADDTTDVVNSLDQPAVVLLAHNRHVTYGYTGNDLDDRFYSEIPPGSILVDPWRRLNTDDRYTVIHYGNTR